MAVGSDRPPVRIVANKFLFRGAKISYDYHLSIIFSVSTNGTCPRCGRNIFCGKHLRNFPETWER